MGLFKPGILAVLTTFLSFAVLPSMTASLAASAEKSYDKLIVELRGDDLLSRHRAEVEIRNRGTELLRPLAETILASNERDLLLESIFKSSLILFFDEIDKDVLSFIEDSNALSALERQREQRQDLGAESTERLESLKLRVVESKPRIERQAATLDELGTITHGEILKRMEFINPLLIKFYAGRFSRTTVALGKNGLLIDPSQSDYHLQRYLLAPLWYWITLIGTDDASEEGLVSTLASQLDNHLDETFKDLRAADYRVRERAEDEFFLLRERGYEYLLLKKPLHPLICDRLLELLDWRIHPRLRERTSMDFADFKSKDFRARREHVIRYARTAGTGAIPTLRLLVLDDSREPSIRVKLTAAEQLAGLHDSTGIMALTQKPIPELMKIPEISRDFFILKGIQYQEEEKYALAIEEFKKILDESPHHFQANYRIGFVYLLNKQYKESIRHFEIARKIRPDDMLTLYNLSCAYSLDGQIEKSIDLLEESVRAGFTDRDHIEKDPDMNPVRGNPRYRRLMNELKTGKKSST